MSAEAVTIQRLNVPDILVIDQQQPQHLQSQLFMGSKYPAGNNAAVQVDKAQVVANSNQPETASLVNPQELNGSNTKDEITFECLISFDKRRDKNLIVKWHHDDRIEPMYQWIPELNKRSIAPQYRAHIIPILSSASLLQTPTIDPRQAGLGSSNGAIQLTSGSGSGSGGGNFSAQAQDSMSSSQDRNQIQILEAGFKLVKPSKELGGKLDWQCSMMLY